MVLPSGDHWWRVWSCPDHLEGLTGLREVPACGRGASGPTGLCCQGGLPPGPRQPCRRRTEPACRLIPAPRPDPLPGPPARRMRTARSRTSEMIGLHPDLLCSRLDLVAVLDDPRSRRHRPKLPSIPMSEPHRYAQAFTVGVGQCWAMIHDRQLQATAPRRRRGPAGVVRPTGDRWWRVWACPEHLDGLTGLREFGARGR